jgi:uncharacterized paraquat-inducible protein A
MNPLINGTIFLACLLFGAGLALPVFSITPGAGDFTGWVRMIRPENMALIQQSVMGGIRTLWIEGNYGLAALLTVFCLLLPLFKFSMLWGEVYGSGPQGTFWQRLCRIISPYAMVEVFVVSIVVIGVKGLPGGTRIDVQSGAWCLVASVLLSLVATHWLHRSLSQN